MESGIYKITCKATRKIYVGKSRNVKKRFKHHMSRLKMRKHSNSYLTSSYLKYGKDNFKYEILENCSIEKLDEREKFYMDLLKSTDRKFGYNVFVDPDFSTSVRCKWEDPEHKKIMSEIGKKNWQDPIYRDKTLKAIKEGHKEQIKKFGCLAFNTPESKRKSAEKTYRNPEYLKKRSELTYEQLKDPIYAKKNLEILSHARKSPKRVENLKKHNEWQAKDEDHKQKLREIQSSYWKDPEHSRKRIEAIKNGLKIKREKLS